jgi:hypothetical protein
MQMRLIPFTIAILLILLPLSAISQSSNDGVVKEKQAPETAEPSASEDRARIAELEAAQQALTKRIDEMQAQVAASAPGEEHEQAIADLADQVATLDEKIEKQADVNRQADESLKEEIDAMAPTSGFKIKGPKESFLKIGALLQARLESTKDAAPSGDRWDFDTYLRRMRLMLYGQLSKWVNFFVETDNPNFGKGSDWSGATFIQDAYLEVNLHEAVQIDVGMLLLPFSHHGMQGATSLLGMDYHGGLIKYPAGSHKVWRDAGVMLRGLFAAQHIEYRLGVFNGAHGGGQDPRNPDDLPRLTGRLTFNVFDAEGGAGAAGMFYDGLYLKKTDFGVVSTKRVLSFGASIDWQADLNVAVEDPALRADPDDPYTVTGRKDYLGAAWDVFFDIPFGERKLLSLNGQANFYYYGHGDRTAGLDVAAGLPSRYAYYNITGNTASYTGIGMASELGVRYSWVEPVILVDFFKSTMADLDVDENLVDMAAYCEALGMASCAPESMGDYLSLQGGVNFYLFGHGTTFKLQAGADKKNGADSWLPSAKFQAQLLF